MWITSRGSVPRDETKPRDCAGEHVVATPARAEAEDEAVGALDQEEHNAGVGKELQPQREVFKVDANPGRVRGGEEPLDGEKVGDGAAEVPTLDVRRDVDGEEEHG
ncbi:hypothetical protein E2562_002746 [Oryza meyeriana var. granulata]|uniref:Uncharacterized protein n=1 Tax=Oryza meyeriana var. granulata TaxID=110450 RepID=A0A6G1BRH8_9ORYZ|nr:hypothetical protein E2562_002746 [Oryza meyeriana var. granulata]